MMPCKSVKYALPIALAMGFSTVFANEPSPPPTKQSQETPQKNNEDTQPQTNRPSKKKTTSQQPPEKISLDYQINDQPMSTVESTTDKPFAIFSEIFHKITEVANQAPGKVVNTSVHIPYPPEMQKSFKEKLPNFIFQTMVETPNGKAKTDFNLAAFKGDINENNKKGALDWGGLTGSFNYTGGLKSLNGNLNMPRLFVTAENEFEILMEKLSMSASLNDFFEPLHFNFQLPSIKISSKKKEDAFSFVLNNMSGKLVSDDQEILEGLRLGRSSFGIEEMIFSDAKNNFILKGFFGETIAQINDPTTKKFVNTSTKFSLNNFSLPPTIANGLTSVSFEMQTSLNNLDAQVLADIKKTLRQIQTQDFTPEMMGVMLVGDLMKALPKVIKGSPLLNIGNFAVKTNQGEVVGSFSIGIDGTKPFSLDKLDTFKMAIKSQSNMKISKDILRRILILSLKEGKQPSVEKNEEGKMDGEKSKKKAPPIKPEKMADEQIKQFIAQKFLVEEGAYYKFESEFKGGKLLLNNQEIPLPF
jgi:hypothetical protein